jgi:hypothetical protein
MTWQQSDRAVLKAPSANDLALRFSGEIANGDRLRRAAVPDPRANRRRINQGKLFVNRVYRRLIFENYVPTFELTNK